MTSDTPKIGFVGLGNMGMPMVHRLVAAGWDLVVHDQRLQPLSDIAEQHPTIEIATSLAELGEACRVVITMLPDHGIVAKVALGSTAHPGFARAMKRGGVIIDMSSSDPLATRALAQKLTPYGIGLVDAPVSGGVARAITGQLTIMAGGEDVLIDLCEPVLEAMGSLSRVGPLGAGHTMKALNNFVSAAGLIATCEALAIADRFGLDMGVMNQVLKQSTGRNYTSETKVEPMMLSGRFDSGFALALMHKDVGLARQLATGLGLAAPELAFVSSYLEKALAALGEKADHTEIFRLAGSMASAKSSSGNESDEPPTTVA